MTMVKDSNGGYVVDHGIAAQEGGDSMKHEEGVSVTALDYMRVHGCKVTVETVNKALYIIKATMDDIQKSLIALRGAGEITWQRGIENDQRASVQHLWGIYQQLKLQYDHLNLMPVRLPYSIQELVNNKVSPIDLVNLVDELENVANRQD